MVEDFDGEERRFESKRADRLKTYRLKAQTLLEKEIYLKKNSYFQRLKLDLQLFHMDATTNNVFKARKAFLLFLLIPFSIMLQYIFIMQVFYQVFVFDVGVVKRRKIWPLNLPADEDISYWPMWRVFVEHYLFSYEFWILFGATSYIVYYVILATASTNFLWSSDPDIHEKTADKTDFSHMALQVAFKSKGEVALVYEYKRIEEFIKAEIYLYLLSLDVHEFLRTKSIAEIEKEEAKLYSNMESFLKDVVGMLLQINEYSFSLMKSPENFAAQKAMFNIKEVHKRVYDPYTSEDIARVYEGLYACWVIEGGPAGIVSYFEFEHTLRQKAPKQFKGKAHPHAGRKEKFVQGQLILREQKKYSRILINWRRNKWLIRHLMEEENLTEKQAFAKRLTILYNSKLYAKYRKDFFDEESHDIVKEVLVNKLNPNPSHTKEDKEKLINHYYESTTFWMYNNRSLYLGSFAFQIIRLKRYWAIQRVELEKLWEVIYDRYFKVIDQRLNTYTFVKNIKKWYHVKKAEREAKRKEALKEMMELKNQLLAKEKKLDDERKKRDEERNKIHEEWKKRYEERNKRDEERKKREQKKK